MSAPTSIAFVKAAMVFSAAPAATPRCAATMAPIMTRSMPCPGKPWSTRGLTGNHAPVLNENKIIPNGFLVPATSPPAPSRWPAVTPSRPVGPAWYARGTGNYGECCRSGQKEWHVSIGLETAKSITAGVRAAAKEYGLKPLTVVVLDAGGHVVSVEREGGSANKPFQNAFGKA